jgi:Tol biopolymer transport system component
VLRVNRRTRVTEVLTRFTSASGYVRYPVWSPRGSRIVFERSLRASSVWTTSLKPASESARRASTSGR